MIALAATPGLNDGVLRIPGNQAANAFSVATSNLGASGRLEVIPVAELRGGSQPLELTVCQTDPVSGFCLGNQTPSASVFLDVGPGEVPTFAVFASAQGTSIPFDPGENRIFVNFFQAGTVRGGTSIAVTTE